MRGTRRSPHGRPPFLEKGVRSLRLVPGRPRIPVPPGAGEAVRRILASCAKILHPHIFGAGKQLADLCRNCPPPPAGGRRTIPTPREGRSESIREYTKFIGQGDRREYQRPSSLRGGQFMRPPLPYIWSGPTKIRRRVVIIERLPRPWRDGFAYVALLIKLIYIYINLHPFRGDGINDVFLYIVKHRQCLGDAFLHRCSVFDRCSVFG